MSNAGQASAPNDTIKRAIRTPDPTHASFLRTSFMRRRSRGIGRTSTGRVLPTAIRWCIYRKNYCHLFPLNITCPVQASVIPNAAEIAMSKTILVVDDSADDTRLLKLMFRRSRILNPVEKVSGVRDAISYLTGEGIYVDRRVFPFPTLLFLHLHSPA